MDDRPPRNFPSWIDEYVRFTRYSNSPAIYRKWSALATVSAALQRKVWLFINGSQIFPNLYVMLCGGPGLGKNQAINPCRDLLSNLAHVALSPARTSPEKFIHLLSKCTKMVPLDDDPYFTQSAYAAFISELSTFIRPNDKDFMTILTDFFDCPRTWTYATLARDGDRIENLCLTLLGGITPKALAENFGSVAFGMGFTARLNIVFSDEYKTPELFKQTKLPDFGPFYDDLKEMHKIHGEFQFAPDAAEAIQTWVTAGMPPVPTDGKLAEYLPRRWLHLIKLCLIYSACENSSRRIELRHYEEAKKVLLEAEEGLPKALEYLGTNPMMEATRNIHSWMKGEFARTKAPLSEQALKFKLMKDVGPQHINQFLQELVNSGYAKMEVVADRRFYTALG